MNTRSTKDFRARWNPDPRSCVYVIKIQRGPNTDGSGGIEATGGADHRQLHGHTFQILDDSMHFILRNIPIAGRFEPGKLERQDMPLPVSGVSSIFWRTARSDAFRRSTEAWRTRLPSEPCWMT
jgi:hypothetical protein